MIYECEYKFNLKNIIKVLNMIQYIPNNTNSVKIKQINKIVATHMTTDIKNNMPDSLCIQYNIKCTYKCNCTFMIAFPSYRSDMVKRTKLC